MSNLKDDPRHRPSDPSYYDISPLISDRTAVFPGDQPFRRQVVLGFSKGDPFELSQIQSTVHIGAHVDAPSHYHPGGEPIDRRDLGLYLGACQVVSVTLPRGQRIFPESLSAAKVSAPRVLFRTGSFPDPNRWNGDFNSLSPELVHFLADQGVKLVGLDTPSVDPADSKGLEAHHAIYDRGLAILEGVVLDQVPDGVYALIALPLRIEGGDASPVRAILLKGALS